MYFKSGQNSGFYQKIPYINISHDYAHKHKGITLSDETNTVDLFNLLKIYDLIEH